MTSKAALELAAGQDFLRFATASVSHFHLVRHAVQRLEAAGFARISETKSWANLQPNGKYFFTRNQSSIIAFAVGGGFQPGNGFVIMGAHTDSPVPKVKPVSRTTSQGYQQVGVELYGGGLWNTWFDRNLSLAGRAIVETEDSKFATRLVDLKRPILCIPNLAIHLNRDIYTKGFNPNKEDEVRPVLCTEMAAQLQGDNKEAKGDHHPALINLMAEELKVSPEAIRDFELCAYDTQAPCIGGAFNEFIHARGLDNQMMSYVTLQALIEGSADQKDLESSPIIHLTALFDNEEIGSNSHMGADSNMMLSTCERLNRIGATDCTNTNFQFEIAMRRSVLISADMAHGVHPNYASKHEANHRAAMGKGLVIKQNANQRYATNSITSFLLSEIARRHDLSLQKFVVRNDSACGSTIGPILSSQCGVRTIDVGIAQFAMHSVREMCCLNDVHSTLALFKAFFMEFSALDASLDCGDEA